MDQISLTGIEVFAHHGVLLAEREVGQTFLVDVHLHVDTSGAAASDELALTVDYGTLAEDIVTTFQADPVDLIETVAERIARLVLTRRSVLDVTVVVHKPDAPIPVPFGDVFVTITRRRVGSDTATDVPVHE